MGCHDWSGLAWPFDVAALQAGETGFHTQFFGNHIFLNSCTTVDEFSLSQTFTFGALTISRKLIWSKKASRSFQRMSLNGTKKQLKLQKPSAKATPWQNLKPSTEWISMIFFFKNEEKSCIFLCLMCGLKIRLNLVFGIKLLDMIHRFLGCVNQSEQVHVFFGYHSILLQMLLDPFYQSTPIRFLTSTIGKLTILWVCIRVSASNISSRVPKPPGSTI